MIGRAQCLISVFGDDKAAVFHYFLFHTVSYRINLISKYSRKFRTGIRKLKIVFVDIRGDIVKIGSSDSETPLIVLSDLFDDTFSRFPLAIDRREM